jgi:hypothetical protein
MKMASECYAGYRGNELTSANWSERLFQRIILAK